MAMNDTQKAALMAYCRIDSLTDTEDALLDSLYAAAVGYMTNAGVSEPEEGTPRRAQYDLCVYAMVLNDWDNRGAFAVGTNVADNPAFRRTLNQLKHTEPPDVSDPDTEGV